MFDPRQYNADHASNATDLVDLSLHLSIPYQRQRYGRQLLVSLNEKLTHLPRRRDQLLLSLLRAHVGAGRLCLVGVCDIQEKPSTMVVGVLPGMSVRR